MEQNIENTNNVPINSNQNIYIDAENEKERIAYWFNQSATSLENDTFCELFEHNLHQYSDVVHKDNTNIYNNLFKELYPDIDKQRQLKITNDLPKFDIKSCLKDLGCPGDSKTHCAECENISTEELDQFCNFFTKKQQSTTIPFGANKFNNDPVRNEQFQKAFTAKVSHTNESTTFQSSREKFANQSKSKNKENEIGKRKTQYEAKDVAFSAFKTAREELSHQMGNKVGFGGASSNSEENGQKRKLGIRRAGIKNKFISPLLSRSDSNEDAEQKIDIELPVDERLKNIEPKMVELIMAEIMDQGPGITWKDIAGLEFAKTAIKEAVVWPMLRPDIFTGLRRPPKGILLFGPPGTGKTLIGKCVASQSKSTFFSISASSLTSKWIGDGEKMVRALFAVARVHQPSVIFIDEVDSLLTQRNETEHESSRRIKTEFLVQLDGAGIHAEERLLIIGATNRPQELDEAARRRFVKRLYIPLPDYQGRLELLQNLISNEKHLLEDEDFKKIADLTEGYSGADIKNLCSEASLEPIRSLNFNDLEKIEASEVRSLTMKDFEKSLNRVKPSVSTKDLVQYTQWDQTYGCGCV